MAELLVFNRPGLGKRGSWEPGDIVDVRPDGHAWGREEFNPAKFRIVKLPRVPLSDLRKYLGEEQDAAKELTKRRAWKADILAKEFRHKTLGTREAWPQR